MEGIHKYPLVWETLGLFCPQQFNKCTLWSNMNLSGIKSVFNFSICFFVVVLYRYYMLQKTILVNCALLLKELVLVRFVLANQNFQMLCKLRLGEHLNIEGFLSHCTWNLMSTKPVSPSTKGWKITGKESGHPPISLVMIRQVREAILHPTESSQPQRTQDQSNHPKPGNIDPNHWGKIVLI